MDWYCIIYKFAIFFNCSIDWKWHLNMFFQQKVCHIKMLTTVPITEQSDSAIMYTYYLFHIIFWVLEKKYCCDLTIRIKASFIKTVGMQRICTPQIR